jgi:hypothetical protein
MAKTKAICDSFASCQMKRKGNERNEEKDRKGNELGRSETEVKGEREI